MLLRSRWLAAWCCVLSAVQALAAQDLVSSRPPERARAPFRALDNIEGAWVDPAIFPVRPLVWTIDGQNLYALNTFDSTVVHFDANYASLGSYRLPWGPVSIALWDNPAIANNLVGGEELLVVCRGSQVLARLDRMSGRMLGLVELDSEPADIVMLSALGRAFVACSAVDVVLEIALPSGVVVRRHAIPSKHPFFLALQGSRVLVAPMLSGNNTTVEKGEHVFDAGPSGMLDLGDPAVAVQGLSDRDLFRIDPATGTVDAVARATGSVLFAHGVNPLSGEHWQLNTEANNRDLAGGGEAEVFAKVVQNRLSITSLAAAGPAVTPYRLVNLDDSDPVAAGVQIDRERTVGQPYALAFNTAGHGFVTGLVTDNVTELDSAGNFVREWNVGPVPRAIALRPTRPQAVVYCMGTNQIEAYDLSLDPPPRIGPPHSVGYDPAPTAVQAGRRIFFDGRRSFNHNASCNSCHIDGGTDMLAWDLSEHPFDDKGPLKTQSMRGIAALLPYHWRGERPDLIDFNGGFYTLLGGLLLETQPGGEFDQFQAFVFSLAESANPFEDPERVVSASQRAHFTPQPSMPQRGSAVRGQDLFFDKTAIHDRACEACHQLPTTTSNEVFNVEPDAPGRRSHFKVAALFSIWRHTPATVETVELADGQIFDRPGNGSGLFATGVATDVLDFLTQPAIEHSAQERVDVASFVEQLDTGLAPAVHRATLLGPGAVTQASQWVATFLLPQARARYCDIAVFGDVNLGAGTRTLRWVWRRESDVFEPEDSLVAPQSLEFFVTQASLGLGRNVFVGLPVGMGERFAVDYDQDGLFNLDEAALGTNPLDPDTDADGDPDGHEAGNSGNPLNPSVAAHDVDPPEITNVRVVYTTTRVAKILFDTAEATRWMITYQAPGRPLQTAADASYGKNHTILLRDVSPDSSYNATITAIDRGGLSGTESAAFQTRELVAPTDTWISSLTIARTPLSAVDTRVTLTATVRTKSGNPVAGQQVIADLYVNKNFRQGGLQGTITQSDGMSVVEVVLSNLGSGENVLFNVMDVADVTGLRTRWSMPDTPLANRQAYILMP